jgi:hypothetical protein
MGVDPVLLAVDEADAWRLLALQAATEACPDEDSRRLAKALTGALPAVRGLTGDDAASRLAAWAVVGWHSALSRLVLGRRTAGGLGLAARPLFAGMVLATAAANFALESARRCLPGATPLGVRIGDRARRRWLDRVTRRVEPNLTFA